MSCTATALPPKTTSIQPPATSLAKAGAAPVCTTAGSQDGDDLLALVAVSRMSRATLRDHQALGLLRGDGRAHELEGPRRPVARRAGPRGCRGVPTTIGRPPGPGSGASCGRRRPPGRPRCRSPSRATPPGSSGLPSGRRSRGWWWSRSPPGRPRPPGPARAGRRSARRAPRRAAAGRAGCLSSWFSSAARRPGGGPGMVVLLPAHPEAQDAVLAAALEDVVEHPRQQERVDDVPFELDVLVDAHCPAVTRSLVVLVFPVAVRSVLGQPAIAERCRPHAVRSRTRGARYRCPRGSRRRTGRSWSRRTGTSGRARGEPVHRGQFCPTAFSNLISRSRTRARSRPAGACRPGTPREPRCPRGCSRSCGSAT